MRFKFSKEKYWTKAQLKELTELVNTKTNEELCTYFKTSTNNITNTMQKHSIRRSDSIIKEMKSKDKLGENNPNWKNGASLDTKKYQATQRLRNPDQKHARDAVYRALKEGRLLKPDHCKECPETQRLEGHHESYAKEHWLDVEWLCKKCHRKRHPDH